MANNSAFTPSYGSGISAAVTATSGSSAIKAQDQSLVITNLGAVKCYIRTGAGSATATAADYCVPAGGQVVITKSLEHDTVAYVCAATESTSIHIITGNGKF